MNPIDWSIRQHLFEKLLSSGKCINLRLGSEWQDSSYDDYEESIYFQDKKGMDYHVLVEDQEIVVRQTRDILDYFDVAKTVAELARPNFADLDEFLDGALRDIELFDNQIPDYND